MGDLTTLRLETTTRWQEVGETGSLVQGASGGQSSVVSRYDRRREAADAMRETNGQLGQRGQLAATEELKRQRKKDEDATGTV